MPVKAHKHVWMFTNDGHRCDTCTAVLTHEEVRLNPPVAGETNHADYVWHKRNG